MEQSKLNRVLAVVLAVSSVSFSLSGCASLEHNMHTAPGKQQVVPLSPPKQVPKQTQNERMLLALQAENPTKSAAWVLDQFVIYLMMKNGGL
jgi:hypothetical protein